MTRVDSDLAEVALQEERLLSSLVRPPQSHKPPASRPSRVWLFVVYTVNKIIANSERQSVR